MPRTAYLAHPIDLTHEGRRLEIKAMADETRDTLRDAGYEVYSPGMAWVASGNPVPNHVVQEVNNYVLGSADLVVAHLPTSVGTIGVPMEIERACILNIPVIAIVGADQPVSFALARTGIRVVKLDLQFYVELEQALAWAQLQHQTRDSNTDELRVVLTSPGAAVPYRAYDDDAGVDLHTAKDVTIEPGDFVDIHTTVEKVQLPPGYWGQIIGRSSTLRLHRLHVPPAVIDPGWRGPLFVGAWNLGGNPVTIKEGQRIGQLILMPNNPAPVRVVDTVDDTPRGTNGFGSSG